MRFTVQQKTIQGKRHENQDRMGYIFTQDALLMVVCDGLGGHEHGEKAATWVLDALAHRFQHFAKPTIADPMVFLEASVTAAHSLILSRTLSEGMRSSPRTTVVCALVQHGQVWFAHAGDSRGYLIRADEIIHRSKDHSKLQFLVDTGRMRADELTHNHPERNRLINCVGAELTPRVEHAGPFSLLENDLVLLCSDGVWGAIEELQLLRLIARGELVQALPNLVATASMLAGDQADDATGVAMRWLGLLPESDSIDSKSVRPDDFQSTIQITLAPDVEIEAMSDAEIDEQIRQIHEAIRNRQNK